VKREKEEVRSRNDREVSSPSTRAEFGDSKEIRGQKYEIEGSKYQVRVRETPSYP